MTFIRKLSTLAARAIYGLEFLAPVVDLGARLWLANVFWKSGLTKITTWDSTLTLFNYVYAVPLLPPDIAAVLATAVELGGAILLAIGLAARFGTAALFVLNAVAVISYSDLSAVGLKDHYYWGLLLLIFLVRGPGKLSLDYWIRSRLFRQASSGLPDTHQQKLA
ncbi:MAG: DoxX family protein [Gammaproteobacteria bacterium]